MAADRQPAESPQDACVFSRRSPLCQTLDAAGVPPDIKWRSAVIYLRGLEFNPSLSLKQRAEIQSLLVNLLRDKDFSEERFAAFSAAQDAVLTSPYRQKLEEALRETTALIREMEAVLGRRSDDVQDLEGVAVEALLAGESPELAVKKLRRAFRKVLKVMKEDTAQLQELARTDALTQLYNRRGFDEYMARMTRSVMEHGARPCLMMLDIDHFKLINDTYGHVIGDQALKVVAGKIRQCLKDRRPGEHQAFRYGGEEFVLVLPDMPLDEVWDLAEYMRTTVERYHFVVRNATGDILHKGVRFTISVGLAQADPAWGEAMVDRLVEAADAALYDAKVTGRNRVSLFEGNAS